MQDAISISLKTGPDRVVRFGNFSLATFSGMSSQWREKFQFSLFGAFSNGLTHTKVGT